MYKDPHIRVNARVTPSNNAWLDEYAISNGLTKSALINMAIESFRHQLESPHNGTDQKLSQQVDRLEELIFQLVDQKHD